MTSGIASAASVAPAMSSVPRRFGSNGRIPPRTGGGDCRLARGDVIDDPSLATGPRATRGVPSRHRDSPGQPPSDTACGGGRRGGTIAPDATVVLVPVRKPGDEAASLVLAASPEVDGPPVLPLARDGDLRLHGA